MCAHWKTWSKKYRTFIRIPAVQIIYWKWTIVRSYLKFCIAALKLLSPFLLFIFETHRHRENNHFRLEEITTRDVAMNFMNSEMAFVNICELLSYKYPYRFRWENVFYNSNLTIAHMPVGKDRLAIQRSVIRKVVSICLMFHSVWCFLQI